MNKVRWGVLSTAHIGTGTVIPAMQQGNYSEVTAIASRDLARARAEAKRLGISKAYGSYEELLADPDIDAIYNPLPNHLHVPWSIKALQAGKHVLCEKPIALNAAEALTLVGVAKQHPDLKIMEAFMYRFHPQWQRARQLVNEGKIGELRTIQSFFSYFNDDPRNIRNITEVGGGGMYDIGCYTVSLARFIFGAEPARVFGIVEYDPQLKTDRIASGILDFGRGTSTFTCSTQVTPYQRVNIFGTEGRIEIEIPFNAPADRPCKMWYQHGKEIEEILLDICNQYTLQGDALSQAILNNTGVPTPIMDAVANMQVIDAVMRSAKVGGWVYGAPFRAIDRPL
ncbi:MAG TPA: Gfo/Idh/MocA family oxidoreductase [Ktedonobacteraceae bacterium]|nr:Gfo/Idh/MocA family oxidoreductase [Ktedonobacteraceae bacterium]